MPISQNRDNNYRTAKLIELSRLSAELDRQALLQTIAEYGAELTAAEACSILLYEPSVGILRFIAGPWYQIEALQDFQVPLEGSIAGRVIRLGQSYLINNPTEDDGIYRQVDESLEHQTRSIAAAPIKYQGQTLGVIEAINKLNLELFTIADLSTLEILAAHAALAVETLRLESDSRKLMQALADLEQRKRDFTAITSHELRTPLGLILGNATFLKAVLSSHPYQEQIQTIIDSAVRLKTIIEALSKVNNAQTGQLSLRDKSINLNDLAKSVSHQFKEQLLAKNIRLILDFPEQPVIMRGDPEKITTIINNLLSNAVAFTPEQGKIWLTIGQTNDSVTIMVKDTGNGIPKAYQERIFERFFQVEAHMTRQHGGMGLGLSIAKDLVTMHNGHIRVESDEGSGSTFIIEFPIPPSAQQTQAS